MDISERTLQGIGNSLLVTLPKGWTRNLKLRKGSKVRLAVSEQGVLTVTPEIAKSATHAEASIAFDRFYARRFFREYFDGAEKITYTFTDKASDEGRRLLSSFLKKFMNVQIIEEGPGRVVVKCFRIDELSIEECLRRMHFLAQGMFDELLSTGDERVLVEMDESITRFYHMLVMQVRRFLTEGKYTEQNQISIIRAMDYRMVAEKVERLADIVKFFGPARDPAVRKHLLDAKGFCARALFALLDRRYDEALELMAEHQRMMSVLAAQALAAKKRKDVVRYAQLQDVMRIRAYARDISMLVR